MSTGEFLTNITIILAVMAFGTLLELVVPLPNVHKIHHSRALAETNSNDGMS